VYSRARGASGSRAAAHRWVFCSVLAAAAAAQWGCSRGPAPEFPRIAILRFENLGPDPSVDWMGRALSEVITSELTASPNLYAIPSTRIHSFERTMGARPVAAPGISAERGLALVAGANRLGYGDFSITGGKLRARLSIADPETGKMTAVASAVAAPDDVIGAASELARQIWPEAPAYRASSASALKDYVAALEGSEPSAVVQDLERAIAAAPNFAPAYRLLAQMKAQAKDAPGALEVIGRALQQDLRPLEKARLQVAESELRGDLALRLNALELVAKLTPSDPTVWVALGESHFNAHAYAQSVGDYQKALTIEPQDPNVLNQLAYSSAHAGDLPTAMAVLKRYQALRPADPNPLDSMGDVSLLSGRLADAEGFYLQAARKAPHFELDGALFKAAMARLMTGDVSGASAVANQYLDARAADSDPALDYRRAEWMWVSGSRREAVARMEAFARGGTNAPPKELASRAYSTVALWELLLGDRAAAARFAGLAAADAGPLSEETSLIARFLTQPPASPAEWASRAEHDFPGPAAAPFRDMSVVYALLLDKQYQPASELLRRIYDSGETGDPQGILPLMLGWTYLETGRDKEAGPLLRANPVPASISPLFSFCFPRVFELRAMAAARAGNQAEAAENEQVFKKLSGDTRFVWDEPGTP